MAEDGGPCNYFLWRDPKMCACGRRVIQQLRVMHGQMLSAQSSWESIKRRPRQQNESMIGMIEQYRVEIINMTAQHRL